jgi:hypothetical protein
VHHGIRSALRQQVAGDRHVHLRFGGARLQARHAFCIIKEPNPILRAGQRPHTDTPRIHMHAVSG